MDVAEKYPDRWVVGADTIVTIEQAILGKPSSPDEEKAMLSAAKGRYRAAQQEYETLVAQYPEFASES